MTLLSFLLITCVIVAFYSLTLPVYFVIIFDWGLDEIITWWITGIPVNFILALPLSKILICVTPKINNWCKKK